MRRRAHTGFSMIEVMVVIAIVTLITGVSVFGVRQIVRSDLRGSASKLAGAIRYCFDRSITTGAYYRMVIDLDNNKYWAEKSDERMYLVRGKEKSPGAGQAFDYEAEEKEKDEAEKKAKEDQESRGPIARLLEPPPTTKRARFQTFKDATLPTIALKKVKFFDLYTPRQNEPYTAGKAYLYFFPDGHTERALIRLTDGDNFYSLLVSPLTGRVEVRSEKYEMPRDFDSRGQDVK